MPIHKYLSIGYFALSTVLLSPICLAQLTGNSTPNAVHAFVKLQESADLAFTEKDYQAAHKVYKKLAVYGDKFSQYRLAIMYYYGYGVSSDLAQAYAWSYVAAESGAKGYVQQLKNIEAELPESQLNTAREIANEYLKDYGLYALAHRAQTVLRKQRKQCTGSRVGASCDRISSTGNTCNVNNYHSASNTCLAMGAVGIPSVAGLQPLEFRAVEVGLNNIMREYGPGNIEFRDFHVIEDDKASPPILNRKPM